jgi:Metallo-peptidase family M12B Reprolysin-like/PKD-like domain
MNTPTIISRSLIRSVSVFILLTTAWQAIGQNPNLWQDVNESSINAGPRWIVPLRYRSVRLDLQAAKQLLLQAPKEQTQAAVANTLTLQLPRPDGKMEEFVVVESPIMEQALADQFPEIKTYAGYASNNPTVTVRFDITPAGFHAMVLSPDGNYFIDPYSKSSTEFYVSYYKKDFVTDKELKCGFQSNTSNTSPPPVKRFGDLKLRTYRLALAATGEYTTFHGGTVPLALAAQVTTMNRVNGIYIKDLAVKMNIVANNNLIVYTNSATDPYTNGDAGTMLGQNQTNLTSVIGSTNYDIGHVFGTNSGGIAGLGVVCNASNKARGVTGSSAPINDPFDVDYVAHEIGHQFSGNHSYNNSCGNNRNNATAWEPGSGSTIMAYAGICSPNVQSLSDAYFHAGNLAEMYTFITGSGNSCAAQSTPVNSVPVISSNTASQTIPRSTPFSLTAVATDADGNSSLTYCWEQMDNEVSTQAPVSTSTNGPNFRSFTPSASSTRFFPRLSDLVNNTSPTWEVLPSVGRTLKFRLVVRDNSTTMGLNEHADITLTVNGSSGPFVVNIPSATGISWQAASTQTVTWDVANTSASPVSCANVDILLSTDGGLTYPTTLASNIPNNGSASITLPNVTSTTARIMVRGSGRAFFDISNNNFTITPCTPPAQPSAFTAAPTPVCQGQNNVVYTVPAVSGATSYTWSYSGTGATITGTTNSVSVNFANNATSGTLSVTANNTCSSTARTTAITVNTPPAQPSAFTAATTPVCQGQNSVVYTVPAVSGATSYTWSYSGTGATITGTTNSASVNFANNATSGTLSVTANNGCGSSMARTTAIVVNTPPAQPSAFTAAPTPVCQGQNNVVYTVPAVSGATSYMWSYSGTGATITGTTNSASVNFANNATSGTLSVTANNGCGSSMARTTSITVNSAPAQPSAFTAAPTPVCQGQNSVVYTVPAVVEATDYTWSYSGTGAAITGTTNSVSVNFANNATSGTLSVTANNICGSSTARTTAITVNTPPTATLTGTQSILQGQSATLTATLTGTSPWSIVVNGQTYSNINTSPYAFSVTPSITTTYTLTNVSNSCANVSVTTNNTATVTVQCADPDLIVENVTIDRYTPNRVEYTATIRNAGLVNASLDAFLLGVYASEDSLLNANDAFKYAISTGGNTLAPNQTLTFSYWSSFDFTNTQYYLRWQADYLTAITECSETNNNLFKLVNRCSDNGTLNLTGTLAAGYYATNQQVTLTNATLADNVLIVGSSISGLPITNINNSAIIVGGCLNVPSVPLRGASEVTTKSKPLVTFTRDASNKQVGFELSTEVEANIYVWNATKKSKVAMLQNNNKLSKGLHAFSEAQLKTNASDTFVLYVETPVGHYASVIP